MRSLIILEVEHGEDTDIVDEIAQATMTGWYPHVTDYTVRVDLPECFVLDN